MRRRYHLLFVCYVLYVLCTIEVHAQPFKIQLEDLTFHSELERECFYALDTDTGVKNMFLLGLAYDNIIIKDLAEALYQSFLEPQEKILFNKISSDKPNTVNKYVYRVIHETYLSKYESGASFLDLMDKGLFNCVSSSMLFALIFEKYGIPYTIKKLPDHVYLLVFPDSKKPVKVETTNPEIGYVLYPKSFKEGYIKNLYKGMIISKEEFETKSTDELFKEYFFNDDDLTLKGLFSLQYLNNTVDYYYAGDYKSVLVNAEKAYYLNPNRKIKSLISSTISLSLQENGFESMNYFELYSKSINYGLHVLTEEQKLDVFSYVTQRYLFDAPNEERYHRIYSFLMDKIKPAEWKDAISAIYYTELCRKEITYSIDAKDALEYGLKALALKPVSFENQRLVYNSFYESTKSEAPPVAYQRLEKILEEFPHLIENKMFSDLKGNLLLNSILWAFQNQKPDIGDSSIDEFEAFMDKYPGLVLSESLITRAFAEAAIYYFRQDKKYEAIGVLKEGLKYAPMSYELKNRLRQLTQ